MAARYARPSGAAISGLGELSLRGVPEGPALPRSFLAWPQGAAGASARAGYIQDFIKNRHDNPLFWPSARGADHVAMRPAFPHAGMACV
ncbi:hypothetical protein DI396_13245 [Litorivita pollutaquae]|uniref:Uncharacterized protein n=1 Tax=Litorivita pollutaquae TaxID=2200892 RepID=A0A2V4NKZ1_9RHOB|nr:hypothetical protein DI396_13245 [Litorivita pollutaquae]